MPIYLWIYSGLMVLLMGLKAYQAIDSWWYGRIADRLRKEEDERQRVRDEAERIRVSLLSSEELAAEQAEEKRKTEEREREMEDCGWQRENAAMWSRPSEFRDMDEVMLIRDPKDQVLTQAEIDEGWEIITVWGKHYRVLPSLVREEVHLKSGVIEIHRIPHRRQKKKPVTG